MEIRKNDSDFKKRSTPAYRGLGLPKKAISEYQAMMDKMEKFCFSSFTSASMLKDIALKYAYKGLLSGSEPVVFEFKIDRTRDF